MNAIEVNPCSNIVQHLRDCTDRGVAPDVSLIHKWADAGVRYLSQIKGTSPKPWSEVLGESGDALGDSFDATLTQAERDAPTFLEWSDESLARMVRYAAKKLHDQKGDKGAFTNAGALAIAAIMSEVNAETCKIEIDGNTKGQSWHLKLNAKLTKKPGGKK